MVTETDTKPLSNREASRLVDRLQLAAVHEPLILRETLRDLPDADVDVLRGLLRIVKERTKVNGRATSAVV